MCNFAWLALSALFPFHLSSFPTSGLFMTAVVHLCACQLALLLGAHQEQLNLFWFLFRTI